MKFLQVVIGVAALGAGCTAPPVPFYRPGIDRERFTRVNLRPEGGVLRSSNFLIVPNNIRAGAPARITSYTESEVRLVLNGVPHVMYPVPPNRNITFPTTDAGIDDFIRKLFVDRKEDLKIEEMSPPDLKEHVLSGNPRIGMTKEQVYACIGPPMEIDARVPAISLPYERILESDKWTYPYQLFVFEATRTTLHFSDGKLQKQEP